MPIYIIKPYLDTDSGDIFCISYSPRLQTVYLGCQNTSLQWYDFSEIESVDLDNPNPSPRPLKIKESDIRPGSKRNKFFADGIASGQATPTPLCRHGAPKPLEVFHVEASNVIDSAHYGYVYSMALLPSTLEGNVDRTDVDRDNVLLVTGSGDETVKVIVHAVPIHKVILTKVSILRFGPVQSLVLNSYTHLKHPQAPFCLLSRATRQSMQAVRMGTSKFSTLKRRR